jgi:hypothetical protein
LFWDSEIARVELRLARHLHDDQPEPYRPCQDELARVYGCRTFLWAGFTPDEQILTAIEGVFARQTR